VTMPPLFIDSIAFWTPRLPSWADARAAFRSQAGLADTAARRPASRLLAPTERRRAPDTVALALEVAESAVQQAGRVATALPSIFVSAHGDLAITDYMCKTLAEAPALLSPTKFHHSVHNAAAGYWGIGTGAMQASSAITAFDCSFATGLLEAATQCAADERAVLLVGYDIAACGALKSVTGSRGLLAAAMVLSPVRGPHSQAAMAWALRQGPAAAGTLRSAAARSLLDNAMADVLPLLEALASGELISVSMPLSSQLSLHLELSPL
jgi:hypothetical protein